MYNLLEDVPGDRLTDYLGVLMKYIEHDMNQQELDVFYTKLDMYDGQRRNSYVLGPLQILRNMQWRLKVSKLCDTYSFNAKVMFFANDFQDASTPLVYLTLLTLQIVVFSIIIITTLWLP